MGKSGVGKTTLVSYLAGRPDCVGGSGSGRGGSNRTQGESSGIRVTTAFWPAKVYRQQLTLFELDLWDAGETASKKYGHILPVRSSNDLRPELT